MKTPTTPTVGFLVCGVLMAPATALAGAPEDCAELMQEQLLESPYGRAHWVDVVGASINPAANNATALVTHQDQGEMCIGEGDTSPAELGQYSTAAYFGSFKLQQTYGNAPDHTSWSTDNQLYINANSGSIWTRSATWDGSWELAKELQCYRGLFDQVLVSFRRDDMGKLMILTLSPNWLL